MENFTESVAIVEKKGSVFGGMLLIVGSCIGAGMLGLPILTGLAGFFPSLIMFFSAWIFMTATALILVEVHGVFDKRVNLITMVGHTLGKWGKIACWVLYLFLFYALLVAYIAASGNLTSSFLKDFFTISFPNWGGSIILVFLFGWVVYLGTRPVDLLNRGLMLFKILSFLGLVFMGVKLVDGSLLLRTKISYAVFALPILVISFGFHNMIPSLVNYLGGSIKRTRLAIIGGGLFTLLIYLIWQIIVLGILPLEGDPGILESLKSGKEAAQTISSLVGSTSMSYYVNALAFFSILTSFIAQALSLTHFLEDGLKISYKKQENIIMCCLALFPPLVLSLLYPQIFFKALNFAGGICAVVLFGIMPVLMVWKARYQKRIKTSYQMKGGKAALVLIFLFALFILFFQISDMVNAPFLPKIK
ncbi:MAG: tyrosine transporter [Chlamydiae bacterium]|nr:tyrosine transporter [Chlamydiota bacterium]